MSKGKSPGIDGISVEFYHHFWNIIGNPLMELFNEYLSKKEMATTVKQGLITLIPKPDKDHFFKERHSVLQSTGSYRKHSRLGLVQN